MAEQKSFIKILKIISPDLIKGWKSPGWDNTAALDFLIFFSSGYF